MRNIVLLIVTIIICSCSPSKKSTEAIPDNNVVDPSIESIEPRTKNSSESFLDYIKKIKKINTPVKYTCLDELKHMDDLENKFIPDGAAIMGLLNSFDEYHFIIYTYPADIRLPILEMYTNTGIKLNEIQLLDMSSCPFDNENVLSRFEIINNSTIRLENISIQGTDTIIVDSKTIILSELID